MIILEVPVTSSRIHASRRVFQILHDIGENGSYLPVVLSLALENTANKDEQSYAQGPRLVLIGRWYG